MRLSYFLVTAIAILLHFSKVSTSTTTTTASTVTAGNINNKIIKNDAVWWTRHITVAIVNDLSPPGVVLLVSCKSKNDDLGQHPVLTKQAFTWKFKSNFRGSTLYACDVATPYGRGGFQAFEFHRDEKSGRCKTQCVWSVRNDGVHGISQLTGTEDIWFRWPHLISANRTNARLN